MKRYDMKNPNIEIISFDLFGTLVYYTKAWWFMFMLRAGLLSKQSRAIFQKGVLTSVTTDMLLDNIIFRENNFSKETSYLFNKYLKDETQSITLFADVSRILILLQQKGYKIAVTSNLAKDFGQPTLNVLPIKPDYIIFSYEEGCRKPDLKIFEKITSKSGVSADKILHIGDKYKNDYLGATNAGMNAILLSRDRNNIPSKETHFIHSLLELENILLL